MWKNANEKPQKNLNLLMAQKSEIIQENVCSYYYSGKKMNLPKECNQVRFTTATGSSINLLTSETTLYVPTFDSVGFDNSGELKASLGVLLPSVFKLRSDVW